jgi:hypothetical protein
MSTKFQKTIGVIGRVFLVIGGLIAVIFVSNAPSSYTEGPGFGIIAHADFPTSGGGSDSDAASNGADAGDAGCL